MSFERRKARVGRVISDKMDKSVVVLVEWRRTHPLYRKSIRRRSRLVAHDADNSCRIGDLIRIIESRPVSRTKRWRVAEILSRLDIAEIQPEDITIDEAVATSAGVQEPEAVGADAAPGPEAEPEEMELEPVAEATADVELEETEPEPVAEATADAEAEAPEPEPVAEATADTAPEETEPEPVAEAAADVEPEEAEPEPVLEAAADAEAEEPEPEPVAEATADAEAEEPEPVLEAAADVEAEDTESEPAPEAATDAETDKGKQSE